MRIPIIEDETKTAAFLLKGLREAGFVADVAEEREEGLFKALTLDNVLLILDAMLPRREGWSVLRELRTQGHTTAQGTSALMALRPAGSCGARALGHEHPPCSLIYCPC
jgi:DNA-binding response OmpR family regulator